MAKVLIIRNLTPEADAALEEYRAQTGIRSNTDAAMAMMAKYHALVHELETYRSWYRQADQQLTELKRAYFEQDASLNRFVSLVKAPVKKYEAIPVKRKASKLLVDTLGEEE